jgi:hypothetical protein
MPAICEAKMQQGLSIDRCMAKRLDEEERKKDECRKERMA